MSGGIFKKTMKTWWMLLLGGPVATVGLVAGLGALLPREHVTVRRVRLKQPAAVIFATVRDFAAAPGWRTGLKSVTLLPSREGRPAYLETSRHGAVAYVVTEEQAPQRLVVEIADGALPYGGTWTFELVAMGAGLTEVRITERGFVKNVIFRFLARFVFGHAATLEIYLRDLAKKLGETGATVS